MTRFFFNSPLIHGYLGYYLAGSRLKGTWLKRAISPCGVR